MISFASPIWLVALAPWAALVVWLLWGRRPRVDVPFLPLWQGPATAPQARRSMRLPPLALASAVLAILAAILAAAQPIVHGATRPAGPPLTIIIDRGITMSARDGKDLRYRNTIDHAAPIIRELMGDGPVGLLAVPQAERRETDRSAWAALAKALPPTALDTHSLLAAAVAEELSRQAGPVIVITDQRLEVQADNRLIQIAPQSPVENLGIVHFAARGQRTAQVMVRVRNQSDRKSADLVITSDDPGQPRARPQNKTISITLPARDGEEDYFIDDVAPGRVLSARLVADDALEADNTALLVREQSWPRIEPRLALPEEIARAVEKYTQLRPPGQESRSVLIVGRVADLPPDRSGVIVAPVTLLPMTQPVAPAAFTPQVVEHPITRALGGRVRWPQALSGLAVAEERPDDSWQALLRLGDRVLLAARANPARQVWIGFAAEGWTRSPTYAMFWQSVFDWAGQGAEGYGSAAPQRLPAEWFLLQPGTTKPALPATPAGDNGLWAGLYRTADGLLRAVNAPPVRFAPPPAVDWPAKLRQDRRRRPAEHPLGAYLCIAALGAMLLSALTWPRRRPVALRKTDPAPS